MTATLFHDVACPWSRAVRIAIGEKNGDIATHQLSDEDYERGVRAPHLVLTDQEQLAGGPIILEFINDAFRAPEMLGEQALRRAEVRRLTDVFGVQFYQEVTTPLYIERVTKPQRRRAGLDGGTPDSRAFKVATVRLADYAHYIGELYAHRRWIAGDLFTIADAMAAAQISLLDLMSAVPWKELSTTCPQFKDWYARVKSRPAFRAVMDDVLPDLQRPSYYADPDF